MSTLIVELPRQAGQPMNWALTPDGHALAGHGSSVAALLPRGDDLVAIVPWRQLSWHRVRLPRVPQGRMRAALEGVLEDALLDEPAQMHMAVSPQARPGDDAWVAACDRAWLREHLQALSEAGHPARRIVPEWSPDDAWTLRVVGEPGDAWLLQGGPSPRVIPLGLAHAATGMDGAGMEPGAGPAGADGATAGASTATQIPVLADPALAAVAEQALARRVEVRPRAAQLVACARGDWDLAQFDLAAAVGGRLGARVARQARALFTAREWRPARWGVVALAAVQLAGLNAWAWKQQHQLDARRAEMAAVLTQTFPGVRLVIDAPLQMERELAQLRAGAGSTSHNDLESLLGALAPALPPTAVPAALEYQGTQLRLRGVRLDAAQLDQAARRAPGLRLRQDGADLLVQAAATGGAP